jgi:AraC-like DNA-binding protein
MVIPARNEQQDFGTACGSRDGLTFGKWLQQLRPIVALRHLANGEAVQQVAGRSGYESVTAFITMFKKALGKYPTQYFSSLREHGNGRD